LGRSAEDKLGVANPDPIPITEGTVGSHALIIHERSIRAVEVSDPPPGFPSPLDDRMLPGDPVVLDSYAARRRSADRALRIIQEENVYKDTRSPKLQPRSGSIVLLDRHLDPRGSSASTPLPDDANA
jgi:hypothetical protein